MSDHSHGDGGVTRRRFLQGAAAVGLLAGLDSFVLAYACARTGNLAARREVAGNSDIFNLVIDPTPLDIGGRATSHPITINGSIPAPLIRLREGREAVLRVTNRLDEPTSIHWHGILLPYQMDGVPGVSFPGIARGETFEYRYPVEQSGTYWYYSHSGLQEQLGHYGPLVVDPAEPDPFAYDRDYAVVLSDWTFDEPGDVLRKLKVAEGYYNYNQRTVAEEFEAEYDWRFTQRLVLQARGETSYAFDEVEAFGVGEGLTGLTAGLRARYHITREFAPYIGVTWRDRFGDTADLVEGAGGDTESSAVVAGVRWWF